MNRVSIRPEMLQWALERAGLDVHKLKPRFPRLSAWELGEEKPTLKQLEAFAKATHVPFGYLFLPEPPKERIPIPDFRTIRGEISSPSPNLLDTIYAMQRRLAWLREERIESEAEPLDFVGSAQLSDDPQAIGQEMRRVVGIGSEWAAKRKSWIDAVSEMREAIERIGVMAVINGVVGNNTHRKLNVEEFRGFSLCDNHTPLIFVNGADAKSAQMFTMAHELAHIWLGKVGEGLSGFENISPKGTGVETFCDKAAAEFLLPARELKVQWVGVKYEQQPFKTLARRFKVSPIVVGRRAMDLGLVDRERFFEFYRAYIGEERLKTGNSESGGDFYNNQNVRVGQMFATNVIRAALEGRLSFREAYDLTGLRGGTFQEYASRLGFDL